MGVTGLTVEPGLLRVAAAFPDPPFDVPGEPPSDFDVELTQAVARELGLRWRLVRYEGPHRHAGRNLRPGGTNQPTQMPRRWARARCSWPT